MGVLVALAIIGMFVTLGSSIIIVSVKLGYHPAPIHTKDIERVSIDSDESADIADDYNGGDE